MKKSNRLLAAATALVLLTASAAGQGRPGSIYNPDRGPLGPIEDKTARRPGDLLTVIISESSDVANEETANLSKQTTLDYRLNTFDLKPNLFNPLPNVGATSQDDFVGTANYAKTGNFTARITAIVMDVLPNGNMVINGKREIRVDNEVKVIQFSGIVRRYDILPANTIESELVAEARVSYVGRGVLTNGTNRTGLGSRIHSAWSWIWPF